MVQGEWDESNGVESGMDLKAGDILLNNPWELSGAIQVEERR